MNWSDGNHININMGAVGPKVTYRGEDGVEFFVHALVGFEKISFLSVNNSTQRRRIAGRRHGLQAHQALKLRVFEADYQVAGANWASDRAASEFGLRHAGYNGVRLTTGLVYEFGGGAPIVPPAAACSVQPS